jgi:hypothetical protein
MRFCSPDNKGQLESPRQRLKQTKRMRWEVAERYHPQRIRCYRQQGATLRHSTELKFSKSSTERRYCMAIAFLAWLAARVVKLRRHTRTLTYTYTQPEASVSAGNGGGHDPQTTRVLLAGLSLSPLLHGTCNRRASGNPCVCECRSSGDPILGWCVRHSQRLAGLSAGNRRDVMGVKGGRTAAWDSCWLLASWSVAVAVTD